MKSFNKISAALLALPLMAAFSACEDEADYTAASLEEGAKVYFATSNPGNVSLAHETGSSFDVLLSRSDVSSAVTVPLNITCSKSGVFTYPSEASFAAGSDQATLTISYDGLQLDYEEVVDFSLNIDQAFQSLYGISNYNFSAMIPAPWASIGVGTIIDDYITGFFGVDNASWEVEIEANQVVPGFYRLVNPYGAGYPYNEPGDYDDTQDYYLEIHAEDPSKVWIPTTTYGMDWGYGNFIFGSMAGLRIGQGKPEAAEGYYGQLADGIITFPADALLIGMSDYNDGGLYTCNSSAAFKVVFPGVVLADYSAEVAYAGKLYDADDNLYIVAEVNALGADVEEVRLAVCAADQTADVVAAIAADETEDYVSLSSTGSASLPFDANAASGKYSIVAVTFAGGEAQEAASANFKYTALGGEPEESWSAYYVGNYNYYQCFDGTDENVVMYGSDDDALRCKLAPWGNGTDFVFIWDDDDNIFVAADQDMEFSESSYGDFFVSDLSSDCALAPGNDWATIIAANFAEDMTGTEFDPGYVDYDNLQIGFNTVYYTSKGYVIGWGYETYDILAQAAARGAKMAKAPVSSHFAQPVRNSQMHWLSEPKQLRSAIRSLKATAKRAF